MSSLPPGWYANVEDPETEHWWDGSHWTGMSRYVSPPLADMNRRKPGAPDLSDAQADIGLEGILTGKAVGAEVTSFSSSTRESLRAKSELSGGTRPVRMLINVLAMILLVLIVSTGTYLILSRSPTASVSAVQALKRTLQARTAHVTVNGSVGQGTSRVVFSGTGLVNFSQNAAVLQLNTLVGGQQHTEKEITLGDTAYLDPNYSAAPTPTAQRWISTDLAQLNSAGGVTSLGVRSGLTTNNPAAIIKILSLNGNVVTALGASRIDGAAVRGYLVEVNQSAIRTELAKAHLPTWMQQSVATSGNLNFSYEVFISSSGLLHRLTINLAVPVNGHSVDGTIDMDFSDFGAPAVVAGPPASQVIAYPQYFALYH